MINAPILISGNPPIRVFLLIYSPALVNTVGQPIANPKKYNNSDGIIISLNAYFLFCFTKIKKVDRRQGIAITPSNLVVMASPDIKEAKKKYFLNFFVFSNALKEKKITTSTMKTTSGVGFAK